MIVEPKIRGFICTTAHAEGCKENVKNQINFIKSNPKVNGPKKVLVIGASTGYGLASRITAAYSCGAATIGIMYEKPASGNRTATAGWYNTAAFEEIATKDGIYAKSLNGDAFSRDMKEQAIALISKDLGKIDMVIYSLASARRTAEDGTTYTSALKATKETFVSKALDLRNNTIVEASVPVANEEEIANTIKVMGGEDWADWIDALVKADVLEEHAVTVAYSYIGPELTYPVYKDGTIGEAKKHLHATANQLTSMYSSLDMKAYISVNKALVTQASSAIPVVPLYMSLLYKVQKENGTHEGCIEQIYRMFHEKLYVAKPIVDESGMMRLDDYELEPVVQEKIVTLWDSITTENIKQVADIDGYWSDFYNLFGFGFDTVDYTKDIDVNVPIASVKVDNEA
ncbi:MAG TPA: enoyl-ACP reductase FabV [Lachnospiraceae bacterium]|nr:enoyl-ACP reductase FabV [Lachnospiraceae bacterium]